MNAEIKAQWIAALRSGEYKQGVGELQPGGVRYCCLGVLCDLHRIATGNGRWLDTGEYLVTSTGNQSDQVLPGTVTEWAGLDKCDPIIPNGIFVGTSLASSNDTGTSFAKIADIIEDGL